MATLEITQQGLNDAVNLLRKVNQSRIDTVMERLCEMGQNAAQTAFGGEVSVTWARSGNGYSVTANGEQVCFLEFGAGVASNAAHPFADDVSFSVAPGSWSQTHGLGQFKPGEREYWFYQKELYTEIPEVHGMWNAFVAITENISKVWQEVMG